MSIVRAILEQKSRSLLDVNPRSVLLDYAPHSFQGLELVNIQPHLIYRGLIQEGLSFSFISSSGQDDANNAIPLIPINRNHDPGSLQLQTPYAAPQLQKKLLQKMYEARTAEDDSREARLYLTLGTLHWFDESDTESARQAPLVFLPVTLHRNDVRSPIVMRGSGEDPLVNGALRSFLLHSFDVELPDLDALHGDALKSFLGTVSASIAGKQGWRVGRQQAFLDTFSLANAIIHDDLDPGKGYLGSNEQMPLLDRILASGFDDRGGPQPDQHSIDELVEPGRLPHVLDANNEQLLVLYDVYRGINQVVEGPPGSGKTQTITNVAAAMLRASKSVLVVSNRTRSLEDVLGRLESVGLRSMALPLYGKHLKRADLLREIQAAPSYNRAEATDEAAHVESLLQLGNQLNKYCKALHTPIRESGVTPYETCNELVQIDALLEGVSRPEFDGAILAGWTPARFEAVLQRTKELETHFSRIGIPQRHPFWGSKKNTFKATDCPEIRRKCRLAGLALNSLRVSATELAHHIGAPAPAYSEDVIRLLRAASKIMEAPNVRGMNVHESAWSTSMEELVTLMETGAKLGKLRKRFEKILIPEAWSQEVLSVRQAFMAHGEKKTRSLIKEYRQARDTFAGLYRNGLPESLNDQLEAVNGILESQRLEARLQEHVQLAETLFGRQWKGIDSDWGHLDKVSSWLYELHQEIAGGEISSEILLYLSGEMELDIVNEMAEKTASDFNTFLQTSRGAAQEVGMEEVVGITKKAFGRVPFGTLLSLFAHWEKKAESLQDIVAFNHLSQRLREEGLGDIVHLAITWSESSRYLTARVLEARYSALMTDALQTRRILASFDGETQNQIIQHFAELDRAHLKIMAERILLAHMQRMAREQIPGPAVHALVHELQEPPLRTLSALFAEAGAGLLQAKPLFLMTPTSVAALLSDSRVRFDLVVIDDAGQLNTLDALGSMARSKQVIAFGDTRQGEPPHIHESDTTSSSSSQTTVADRECILETMRQKGVPSRTLRWIQPNRPSALMRWMNSAIYENRLHVPPGASQEAAHNALGLHEISAAVLGKDGAPTRSLTGSVVEAIFKHAEYLPGKSIGVVVDSEEAIAPIVNELERRRQRDPSFEAFFKAHETEPFFIKTIDAARGDLRDVIYYTISFKQNFSGHFAAGLPGGIDREVRRRLATLSSTVRRECHVFTDTTIDELKVLEREGRVSRILVNFLQYINQMGVEVEQPVVASKFELAIADALRLKGYETALGVGNSGFRVNLAVMDEARRGGYVLGILCDGEQYAAAQSARERDRLLPEMLETLGWRLHRVWSVEWQRNPERELAKLLDRLQQVSSSEGQTSGIVTISNGSYRSMKDAH